MSDKITMTLPASLPDQTDWHIYQTISQYETPPDDRRWYEKWIYRALMWMHNKAEDFWHWCYYTSLRFAKPEAIEVDPKHILIDSVSCVIGDKN